MADAGGGRGVGALLSTVATIALVVAALGLIRAGLGDPTPAARRWAFLEEEAPESLGLVVERPAAGAWSVAAHPPATGARALVSAAGDPSARSGLALAPATRAVDAVVSTRCRAARARAERACGVVLRHTAPGSFYLARVDEQRALLEIVRAIDHVETPLAAAAVREHAGWYALELEVRADAIRAVVDGGRPLVVRDGALAEGVAGLWAPADGEVYFDELAWRSLGSGAPASLPFFQLGS